MLLGCESKERKNLPSLPTVTPSTKTTLLGRWRLADINVTRNGNKDPLSKTAADKRILQEGLIFSFFEDGTFTNMNDLGEYDFGKWNFVNGKKTVFLESKKYPDTFENES